MRNHKAHYFNSMRALQIYILTGQCHLKHQPLGIRFAKSCYRGRMFVNCNYFLVASISISNFGHYNLRAHSLCLPLQFNYQQGRVDLNWNSTCRLSISIRYLMQIQRLYLIHILLMQIEMHIKFHMWNFLHRQVQGFQYQNLSIWFKT